jgi:hypothetical protein
MLPRFPKPFPSSKIINAVDMDFFATVHQAQGKVAGAKVKSLPINSNAHVSLILKK